MSGSINNIKLNHQMLAMLYGHALVEDESTTHLPKAADRQAATFKYLGNNEKKITVLVSSPGHTFLPEIELQVLTRMLDACRMNIGDVAIVNISGGKPSVQDVFDTLQPIKALSFGTQPAKDNYTISSLFGTEMLNAPSLSFLTTETEEVKQMKSKIWVLLKQMFGL